MNMTLMTVLFYVDWNEVVAAKLNTLAQMCNQEVLVRFEPTIFQLIGGCLKTLRPGLGSDFGMSAIAIKQSVLKQSILNLIFLAYTRIR